jgi:ribonuclease BN (tRNA processing enzyme)/tetratricopeptide (TPR) repeat protein
MANSVDNLELEKLNAQIDVWIDDEAYGEIQSRVIVGEKTGKPSTNELKDFFLKLNYCTSNEKEEELWQRLLDVDREQITVKNVDNKGLPIDNDWFHLLYAKLLRAKIQQRADSDCYIRRLDNVAAYLERHLPQYKKEDDWGTRLTLMCLMELSAICQHLESQGYSERARRVIQDSKHRVATHKGKENKAQAEEKAAYEFYELWARYNIGVAYFHQRKYRQAVQEFNRIIWQVKKWAPEDKDGIKGKSDTKTAEYRGYLTFFKNHKGNELLLMPAKLYRAEVQLKLQMAYHTLATLSSHEKGRHNKYKGWGSDHQQIKADIIRTQAYQQLGRLDKSWDTLNEIYSFFVVEDQGKLKRRRDYVFPKEEQIHKFPGLGQRFFDILIEDHLQWINLDGEDEKDNERDNKDLRHLVKYSEIVDINDYNHSVDDFQCYLTALVNAFKTYWKLVKHNANNRRGYFQQVAKYLGWFAKASEFKAKDCSSDAIKEVRQKIVPIAKQLYAANKDRILEEEPGLGYKNEKESNCLYCSAEGIDLRRIDPEHYAWFTQDMLSLYEDFPESISEETTKSDKKRFVNRLLELERMERNDLRINGLKLHYKLFEPEELLRQRDNSDSGSKLSPVEYAKWLCRREFGQNMIESFSGLLSCDGRSEHDLSLDDVFASDDYEKTMQEWDDYFVRHLESPSVHEHDTKENEFYFIGLQRWNSSSPAKGYSVGGGYLLYHLNKDREVDLGIVIDPGFDFVRNLFHSGFSLDDIDIVLISHAHVDHIRDFESIVTLIYELGKKKKRERRVHVILSLGTYERLEHIIESPGFRYFIEPYIIDIDREIDEDYFENLGDKTGAVNFSFEPVPGKKKGLSHRIERFRAILPEDEGAGGYWVRIMPTRAYHNDHTDYSDSFGFLIKLKDSLKGEEITFGNTGDTKWVYPDMLVQDNEHKFEDIAEQYKDCDALIVHLGSLVKRDRDEETYSFKKFVQCAPCDGVLLDVDNKYFCEKQVRDENHPYLVGMLRLLSSLASNPKSVDGECGVPLILVSEFGEELKGRIRTDFVHRLQQTYGDNLVFLPVDVGTNVQLRNKLGKLNNEERGNKCTCKVWCVQCQKFEDIFDARFKMFGNDNALYCVCKTCLKAIPADVLQTTLSKLYEVGYDIITKTNNDNKNR